MSPLSRQRDVVLRVRSLVILDVEHGYIVSRSSADLTDATAILASVCPV